MKAEQEKRALKTERSALANRGPSRNYELLVAAKEWLTLGNGARAEDLLDSVGKDLVTADDNLRTILSARIALLRHAPEEALSRLTELHSPATEEVVSESLEIKTIALFAKGLPADAVVAALSRERLLGDVASVISNRWRIWNGLRDSDGASFVGRDVPLYGDDVQGWLELNHAARIADKNAFYAQREIGDWRARHATHSANDFLRDEVLPSLQAATDLPRTIALLLPLSGAVRSKAELLRDGFIAASLYASADRRPVINIYDTDSLGVDEAYRRATSENADFVVGPLLKENVRRLFDSAHSVIPTLVLNDPHGETRAPAEVFQFWLDPAADSRQLANHLVNRGLLYGVALLPNNDWGRRVRDALGGELDRLGGQLIDTRLYDTASKDFDRPVSEMLLIDESKARIAALRSKLGVKLFAELRPRADIDFVLVGGGSVRGQLFSSMVKFYANSQMPIFATSEVFDPDSKSNKELNGVAFTDMPWMISPERSIAQIKANVEQAWPNRSRSAPRLFALGFDAYQLIPLIRSQSTSHPLHFMSGLTGDLTVGKDRTVDRRLEWARIKDGRPILVPSLSSLGQRHADSREQNLPE